MHLDTKKLSATRNIILDLRHRAKRLALRDSALLMELKNTAFLLCFGALAWPVGPGWMNGWIAIPALASPCLSK
jgi:hypothetical protein